MPIIDRFQRNFPFFFSLLQSTSNEVLVDFTDVGGQVVRVRGIPYASFFLSTCPLSLLDLFENVIIIRSDLSVSLLLILMAHLV